MITVTLIQLICGLGMICGILVAVLGYIIHVYSRSDSEREAARMIGLLGLLVFATMTLFWSIEVFQ